MEGRLLLDISTRDAVTAAAGAARRTLPAA